MDFSKLGMVVLLVSASFTMVDGQEFPLKKEKKIEGVTIRGNTKKSTESNIIAEQKKSAGVIERIGAVQLEKQGIGNVATAVTKATGTVKQEGSSTISVRGLLDRYNTTSFNGLPIPSDDPENKNMDLSILSTDMIEFISIEKVFHPRLTGDFGGANIDIVAKEYRGKPFFGIKWGSSVNTQVFNAKTFYLQEGPNFWGFDNTAVPKNTLQQYQIKNHWHFKDLLASRNFMPINSALNIDAGKSLNIGNGKLSAYFFGGFGNDYRFSKGKEANYNSIGNRLNDFSVEKFAYNTNTTGLLHLFYNLRTKHRLKFISNYINTSHQNVRLLTGYNYDWASNSNAYIRRAEYKQTSLWINQLGGAHQLSDQLHLNWIAGYNFTNSRRPDRMSNTLLMDDATGLYRIKRDGGASNRYFDDLKDTEFSENIDFSYKIDDHLKLSAGYQGRYKWRGFWSKQYDFRYSPEYAGQAEVREPNDLDDLFNAEGFNSGYFSISSNKLNADDYTELKPISFNGTQVINAGFLHFDGAFNERLTMQIGARLEHIHQDIRWDSNYTLPDASVKRSKTYQKIIPSLNVKYELDAFQNVRISASRTYTLPQMKEMAPFMYEDVTETNVGNTDVKPSDNNNLDLKWEYFPKSGEVFSLTGYGKYIQNPISKALIGEGLYSYLNVGNWAYVWGFEAEIRKTLYKSNNGNLYAFLNASYLNSQSELNNDKILKESIYAVTFNQGVRKDQLQGAANFIANANLGYHKKWNANTMDLVISYAYVGEYLYSVSTQELGNIVQKPINLLDANLKFVFSNHISLGLNAKNLLNPDFKRVQMTQTSPSTTYLYEKGRTYGLSLGYQF